MQYNVVLFYIYCINFLKFHFLNENDLVYLCDSKIGKL